MLNVLAFRLQREKIEQLIISTIHDLFNGKDRMGCYYSLAFIFTAIRSKPPPVGVLSAKISRRQTEAMSITEPDLQAHGLAPS